MASKGSIELGQFPDRAKSSDSCHPQIAAERYGATVRHGQMRATESASYEVNPSPQSSPTRLRHPLTSQS